MLQVLEQNILIWLFLGFALGCLLIRVTIYKSLIFMPLPLDNLQSSLAVNTPEAEMVSLQTTSLNGLRG